MSIWTSLFTGSSGLEAHGNAMSVVGDNIANVSTTGFKGSRAGFADVIGGTTPDGQGLGVGTSVGAVQANFRQGALSQTAQELDLAIRGGGFFAVAGNHDGINGTYYTRDGRFHLDENGAVVNADGLRLQGYSVDATGAMGTTAGDLLIGGQFPPRATSELSLSANLDAGAVVGPAWNPANPAGTSNWSTSVTAYDSLGKDHRVDMYYRATGNGGWEWHAMVDGGEITGGQPGVPSEIGSGTLTFNPDGKLQSVATNNNTANFLNAVQNQAITFEFGDPVAAGGTGLAGSTQFAGPSSVRGLSQDGYSAGTLQNVVVAEDGKITGRFSNGKSREIGQVALATFPSDAGLRRVGSAMYTTTASSGEPLLGAAATGNRGGISAGTLEGSNVDLGNELVTMIAYQRAFQANARTVSTADEMLAEISNLKR